MKCDNCKELIKKLKMCSLNYCTRGTPPPRPKNYNCPVCGEKCHMHSSGMVLCTLQCRFIYKVKRGDSENDCWIWMGKISKKNGRPLILLRELVGKRKHHQPSAVNYSYSLFVGDMPQEKIAVQDCKNNICVNPKHLKLIDKRN